MSFWIITAVLAIGCALALYISKRVVSSQASHPLPPGPPGLPWVGNVIGIDMDTPWKTYAKWSETYGDIVYSRLMGKDIIIVNSIDIAKDLLERRSRNYSDRPYLITNELCGIGFNSALLCYGDRWRLHRRFFHQTFRSDAVSRFVPLMRRKACNLLRQLLNSPEELKDHVFEYLTSVILNNTYDYDPASRKDEFVNNVANVLSITSRAVRPDISVIVGAFPFLLHLPSWLPGMSFKTHMANARKHAKKYLDESFAHALRRVQSGNVGPSMVHDALQGITEKGIFPEVSWMQGLKEASGTAFLGASDTSNSTLMTFFLMMVLNPEVQEKAQKQIDAVVGRKRLPTVDDRPMLPLLDAIFYEMLRCQPPAPISIPHAAVDDDVYDGYHIPKGAIILSNLWWMTHNQSRYPNPDAFIPERFLNEDGTLKPNDIHDIVFGFGQRVCVGRYYANASIWIAMANVLTVFKILKPLDENGVEIAPDGKYVSGIVQHPLPFKCRIVPRFSDMDGERLEQLIGTT